MRGLHFKSFNFFFVPYPVRVLCIVFLVSIKENFEKIQFSKHVCLFVCLKIIINNINKRVPILNVL